jgi:hypothetical protein
MNRPLHNVSLRLAVIVCVLFANRAAKAQEAEAGIDVRATVTAQAVASNELTQAPRPGAPVAAGYRTVVYPTFKLNEHLTLTAALQSISRPYYYEDLSAAKYSISDDILQAALAYARVSENGSMMLRAGVLSTAFGSYPLRYDDADNPLCGPPLQYGYYYSPVTTVGLLGVQMDATSGKWDGRLQLTNSSPANPRSAFAADQYVNWTAGGGYTIRQGFRIGVSAYRGPFLSRDSDYFFPGEAKPKTLSARAAGVDVQWSKGHWILQGEWQTFVFPHKAITTFREQAGYVEAKRVLTPRWYVAGRGGFTHTSPDSSEQSLQLTGGFRPNRLQTIKLSYGLYRSSGVGTEYDHMATIQLVTSLHLFSRASE